jgi:hypothetical protein
VVVDREFESSRRRSLRNEHIQYVSPPKPAPQSCRLRSIDRQSSAPRQNIRAPSERDAAPLIQQLRIAERNFTPGSQYRTISNQLETRDSNMSPCSLISLVCNLRRLTFQVLSIFLTSRIVSSLAGIDSIAHPAD